jgi:hypothetical protein
MKKILFLFALILASFQIFSQTVYYPGSRIFTGTFEISPACTTKVGTFYLVKNGDSIWWEKPLGTWVAPVTSYNFWDLRFQPIETTETVSRTIYVSTTGSDVTGDGTIGLPFATVLKAVQDIKTNVVGCTITISISGTGDFPQTMDLAYEIAKKNFIKSELAFVGTTINTVESGFTLAKLSNRCFAYTLSKVGLTSTLNQYRHCYMKDGTSYYPIAYNAAGTNSFEIEFLHNNKATCTELVSFGVSFTNADNSKGFLDFSFKTSINSVISFSKINVTQVAPTVNIAFLEETTNKSFSNVLFNVRAIEIGDNSSIISRAVNVAFASSIIAQTAVGGTTSGNLIWIYKQPKQLQFNRTLLGAYTANQGCFSLNATTQLLLLQSYIYGSSSIYAFWALINPASVTISQYLEIRSCAGLAYTNENFSLTTNNQANSVTTPYFEFISVTNILGLLPRFGVKINIANIYGPLPTTLIAGLSSGYKFVEPKNDIHISVPGIYGEYEQSSSTLTNNAATNITIGNTAQNNSIHVEYTLFRGAGYRTGSFDILYDGTTTYLSPDTFIDNAGAGVSGTAIVFSTSLSTTNILLTGTLDASGGNATFQYSVTRKMK